MKAIGRATTCTFPLRTYLSTIDGITVVSNALQIGHWRSMYSISCTGAFGDPSVVPCCGMPRNSASTAAESGSVDVFAGDEDDEDPRVSAIPAAAAPPRTRMTAAAIRSTLGEAWRAPLLRTGGGGVRRCCRA